MLVSANLTFMKAPTTISSKEKDQLIETLKQRFENNVKRHQSIEWHEVELRLTDAKTKNKLWSLNEMEKTGGEPDVIAYDQSTDTYIFCDCAAESPKGRRSVCYDLAGLESRKEHKPKNNAVDMAKNMGIEMLDEQQYKNLQKLGVFDAKTSSWIKTPDDIRKLGGALFADYRYGHVFVYHNGAQSYYGARAFRGMLKV